MKRFIVMCLAAVVLSAVLFLMPALSQEDQAPAVDTVQNEAAQAPVPAQAKELSVYGEVQAVNPVSGSLTVQYYDYETDEEKTIEAVVNKDTRIENAATLNDIKKGDWVDMIYTTASDAKNTAKSILVEKEEEATAATGAGTTAELPDEE